jgi:hypothetical protein
VSENSEAARVIGRAKCGALVPAEDPAAFCTAMLALKTDPELRRVLGANAHVYAETHFTKASVTNLPRLRSLNLLVGTIFVLFRILVIVFCSQIAVLRHCNLRPHRSPREETEWP